jgi:hypothetical protein
MNTDEIVKLRNNIFKDVADVMDNKGKEYSGHIDRLANFKRNGANLGLNPETIWSVYASKHWDSLMSFIRELQNGKSIAELESTLSEPIDGRILDIITYLILLQGLISERREK